MCVCVCVCVCVFCILLHKEKAYYILMESLIDLKKYSNSF